MRNFLGTITTLLVVSSSAWSQVGPVSFIDTSFASAGVSAFVMADLDNDGDDELLCSFFGNSGRLDQYDNLGGSFSAALPIAPFPFCKGLASSDLDGDGWKDLVAIGGIGMEARVYFNNNGSLAQGSMLDSNISIQVNDLVVVDLDGNSSNDIVIIGQHSIDLYRNDGSGNFSKEVILSTATSPFPLECLDLDAADMDGDGDLDLICGETAGLVVYENDGNATFTPQYYSVISEIGELVQPMDVDADGDTDVLMKTNTGTTKWFSNDGNGALSFEALLPALPSYASIGSLDHNGDGLEDLYLSYLHHVSIFLNDASHSFASEVSVYQDNGLLMGAVHIGNVDDLNTVDLLWSGGNNTIAFHLGPIAQFVEGHLTTGKFLIYPNPATGLVQTSSAAANVQVYDATGRSVLSAIGVKEIDLSLLPAGVYNVLVDEQHSRSSSQRLFKY